MISETRKRSNRYLFLGLILALVSAFFVMNTIADIRASAVPPPTPTVEPQSAVLYAAAPVASQSSVNDLVTSDLATETTQDAAATEITTAGACPPDIIYQSPVIGSLQVCMIPSRFAPPSAVKLDGFISEMNISDPAVVRTIIQQNLGTEYTQLDIQQGAIILREFLATNRLAEGLMEVSLAVNSTTSVGGRVRPGQRVDVIVSYKQGNGENTKSVTEVLLQAIEVLAVVNDNQRLERLGQYSDPASGAAYAVYQDMAQGPTLNTSVVLALSPEDAIRLTYMINFAQEVRLLIRRPGDHKIRNIAPVTLINP